MALHMLPRRIDAPARSLTRPDPPAVDGELSSGEVGFLHSFMQGSIMVAEVRWALRKAWGFCPRHTAAWLKVEAAFRHRYLHGPAVLYDDLMERACAAFDLAGPGATWRLVHRLRAASPCYLCAMDIGPSSHGYIQEEPLAIGRDPTAWQAFAHETQAYWQADVCGACAGTGSSRRCRAHLCDDLNTGRIDDIEPHRRDVLRIARHLRTYHDSFQYDKNGIDTVEDRAALVSAAGWCGGWRGLLAVDRSARH
jgi:hypothetical protein